MRETISVDFDGVIHKYSGGWQEGEIYDDPIDGSFETLMQLYKDGYNICISTARTELESIRTWWNKWYHIKFPNSEMFPIEITNTKPIAIAYIDDRGITFTNWDEVYHTLSQTTKQPKGEEGGIPRGSIPTGVQDVTPNPTSSSAGSSFSGCEECQDFNGKECIADPLPEDVNTCFKAKEALYK